MQRAVAGRSWDRIVSSPLERCADFARELALEHALPFTVDTRWRELDFGAWEGKTAVDLFAEDAQALGCFWVKPDIYAPPGGEELMQLEVRVLAAWNDLLLQCSGLRVLVVTHGGPIRVVIAFLRQRPLRELLHIDSPVASLTEIGHAHLRHVAVAAPRC